MKKILNCSIIIPVFNNLRYTRKCLKSIMAVGFGGSFEIIVVNNASSDGTTVYIDDLGRDFPFITQIINTVNLGFARACNIGAEAAQGRYLVFLNNDVVVTENWLEKLLEPLEINAGTGICGARCLFADGTIQHAGVSFRNHKKPFHHYRLFPGNFPLALIPTEYNCVTGACMAFRRKEFMDLGRFDEEFINAYEDIDICLRFRQAGYQVFYQPEALIIHHESKTAGRFDYQNNNLRRLYDKWQGKKGEDEFHYFKLNEAKALASGLLQPLKKLLPRDLAAMIEPAPASPAVDGLSLEKRQEPVVLQLPLPACPDQQHLFISLEAMVEQYECRLKLYYQTKCEPFYCERKSFQYYLHQGPGSAPFVLPPAGMLDDEFNGIARLEIELNKTAVSLTSLKFYTFPRAGLSPLFLRESYAEQYYAQEKLIRLEREFRQQKRLIDLAARARRGRELFAPDESIVIFGTGSLAEWILLMLDLSRININCFFDNKTENDVFHGFPVQKPAYIEGARVIIASMFENEIRLQLRQIGYRDDQIIVFSEKNLPPDNEAVQTAEIKKTC